MQPTSSRLRARTFTCMGTVVSLTLPQQSGSGAPGFRPASPTWASPTVASPTETSMEELEAATAVVEQVFAELEAIFSLYRPDSEASRMARDELRLSAASDSMHARYAEAAKWRLLTGGAFTPDRSDGVTDLSGIVKGHAIREAGTTLLALGLRDWCLNAGGDVLVNGSPTPGREEPWLAGIVDPADRRTLLTAFPLGAAGSSMAALATSGTAERGHHIWTPGLAQGPFRQVSVAAADIVTADVLATAIMAGGHRTLDLAVEGWDVAVLAVENDGGLLATPGFRLSAGAMAGTGATAGPGAAAGPGATAAPGATSGPDAPTAAPRPGTWG